MKRNESKLELVCDSKKIARIVSCVEESVGDEIKQDMQKLLTSNCKPSRIWDILNTKLCSNMNVLACVADVTKRGSWEMVPVFDCETGILYTLMRENRYEEIRKKQLKGKNKHYYVNCLIHVLNPDLVSPVSQMNLFEPDPPDVDFMTKTVQKILADLKISDGLVKRHALILFNSQQFELTSIRAVMIDRNMDVVFEDSWNKYILKLESTVMDIASDFSPAANNPSRGLELTPKAAARKNNNLEVNKLDIDRQKQD